MSLARSHFVALLLSLPWGALAADARPPAAPQGAATQAIVAVDPAMQGPARLSPLAAELLAARASFERERDALYAELAATHPSAQRIRLQRQLEQLKIRSELRLIEIQLDHARRRDDTDTIAELEAILDAAVDLTGEARQ
jgi:hypothetical protein